MAQKPPADMYAAPQTGSQGASILILTADNTHDLEFFYPYYRFIEAGYKVDVATPKGGKLTCKNSMGIDETIAIKDAAPARYAMIYIPGGKAPEALKKEKDALQLVKEFAQTGKPIAAICHGAQVLSEAGVIAGRKIAAWPDVEPEIQRAGGEYVSEAARIDGQFITGRWPADLPQHVAAALAQLSQAGNAQPRAVGAR